MKTRRLSLLMIPVLFFGLAACEKDGLKDMPDEKPDVENANVRFEMDASALGFGGTTRAIIPTYGKTDFNIYAYKLNDAGNDYVCNMVIEGDSLEYSVADKKLTGSFRLPIGKYRFIPSYGLKTPHNFTIPTVMDASIKGTDQVLTHQNTGPLPEIFMTDKASMDALKEYELGLVSESAKTVSDTLKRAVSRIDVIFIKAQKEADGSYTELPYAEGENIFGGPMPKTIMLKLEGLNETMNFIGQRTGTGMINADFNLLDRAGAITMGNSAQQTKIGKDYANYDNVQKEDIINGSAHVCGAYVVPGLDATKTASLKLYLEPQSGTPREITITTGEDTKLPLERNKVTLVKVYVLEGNVFTTKVNFGVSIDTDWLSGHEVIGEVN